MEDFFDILYIYRVCLEIRTKPFEPMIRSFYVRKAQFLFFISSYKKDIQKWFYLQEHGNGKPMNWIIKQLESYDVFLGNIIPKERILFFDSCSPFMKESRRLQLQ